MMGPGISENECPREEISSYIDGELSVSEEAEFETHLAECKGCRIQLKQQKEFLLALNASLEAEPDLPLPKDFTRTIVANAESRVSGLRKPREQFTAMFICAALFFFALFAMGDAEAMFRTGTGVFEKVFALAAFLMRFAFNIFVSIAVILRSLFSHVSFSWGLLVLVVPAVTALFVFSRSLIRGSRTQEN